MTLIELLIMLSLLTGLISGAIAGAASGGLWFVPGALIGGLVGFVVAFLAMVLMAALTAFMLWWTGEIQTLNNPTSTPAEPPPTLPERSRWAKLQDDAISILVLFLIVALIATVWFLSGSAAHRLVGPKAPSHFQKSTYSALKAPTAPSSPTEPAEPSRAPANPPPSR